MSKAEETVDESVANIDRGEIRLSKMRRQYVWKKTRVRDLLDWLYRGYQTK